jgi:hypothetical protein
MLQEESIQFDTVLNFKKFFIGKNCEYLQILSDG